MMEFEYSPRHSPGNAAHLLSPTHAHGRSLDGFASIQQIRRSLSRSPSKPARYSLHSPKKSSTSPTAPSSPSALSRAVSADAATELSLKPKVSAKRAVPLRATSRRTSPNSPLRRALSDNTNQANASPRIIRRPYAEQDQENMDCDVRAPTNREARKEEARKIDFLKPDKLLQAVKSESASPMKSSPLKRSDGVMNLEAASFGSPRNKRRSIHGSTFSHDFNIFDYGLDGANSDSADSAEEKDAQRGTAATSTPVPNSPQRRPLSLRKSTLQQRAGPGRSRLFADIPRDSGMTSPLTRTRSRFSLDGSLPLHAPDLDAFRRSTANEPPVLFQPPAQKLYQSAPKPHPLSHALTPSSSASSMADEHIHQAPSGVPTFPKPAIPRPQPNFAKSLPIGAMRPAEGSAVKSSQSSQESFATPDAYRMAKPVPQAFMSTGLISKRNRNMGMPSQSEFGSSIMPDTPSKKTHILIPSSPAPPSALGKVQHASHEFGSPSTPFSARNTKFSPESFGKGVNIFGSRVGAPQLTRRGSFISLEYEDLNVSPTQQMDSQASTDDLPPTPTKSTSTAASTTIRPQSKGKSNSLRSSLFGRRASLGPDTFAAPSNAEESNTDQHSKSPFLQPPFETPEKVQQRTLDESPMPFITLTACATPTPTHHRSRSDSTRQAARSPSPLAKRSMRSAPLLKTPCSSHTKPPLFAAPSPDSSNEKADKRSPHTPSDHFAPPDPSNLSISVDHRQSTTFGSSGISFPPATPTGPREHAFNSSLGQGHQSSGYFTNDVDTSLTARFGLVTTLGMGEFSQVYRVEKPASDRQRMIPAGSVWAVKKSRKAYIGNKDRQRKMREVQILKMLRGHEHLVNYVDHWEAKNHLYIQTEFCENGNLKDFLLQTGFKGRLDDFRIWKILLELSQGIKTIHDSSMIHLDLKPANVFIDWEGVLKIGDFGMASSWPAPPGLDGEGDREYIGPEILRGQFDKPADIFALGMIMLEIAGNIVLPDNGNSWQRLRAGDMSDLPSLSWSSESSLVRDVSGDPVELMGCTSNDSLCVSNPGDDDLSFLKPAAQKPDRSGDLVTPPNFMIDSSDPEALDRLVQWMICPEPERRPTVDQLLMAGGVQWVERRRRAGATVFEGSWGPADEVLNHQQDVEMMGM